MLVSAVIASAAAMFTTSSVWEAIKEAFTIILAAFILIAVTSIADWAKDRRFVQLQALIKEDNVTVIRGKVSAYSTISIWDLVVGDVITLNTGAQVPADCLVLTAADLQVSPPNQDVDGNPIHKKPYGGDGYDVDSDPFLHSGSMITRGQCKALVCCVGKDSSLAQDDIEKLGVNDNTALQKKLKNLTDQFTLGALYSAIIIFVILTIRAVIASTSDGESGMLVKRIVGFLNIAVVLVVVSVPEGLPLTIGVSLAFSVMTMYQKGILVRKLDAPEKLGGVEEIVCGKTATLTKNKMRVNEFYVEGKHIRNTRNDTFL
jgi:Ca2+-transporting ATPase